MLWIAGGNNAVRYELAYGRDKVRFTLPDDVKPLTVRPAHEAGLPDPRGETARMLRHPIGTSPLPDMLREKKPEKIVVVVNDITRPTPYDVLFPPLLDVFAEAGIRDEQVTLIIATGIHDPHTEDVNRAVYGEEIVERFRIINHDGADASNLVYLGRFASGYDFVFNRTALEADFLITFGVVMPHYFAGYSGGRKSVLPGLVSKETVQSNHARMVELMDDLPPVDRNPVSNEMIEAARMVGVDFILNVVTNDAGEVVCVVAGDVFEAWRKAVDVSSSMFEVPFAEQTDICVTCACGHPRDINAYQAQKALDHADHITRAGGTIILAAECAGKWGENVFEEWIRRRWEPDRVMREIKSRFVLGAHKAYAYAKVASEKRVLLFSSLSAEESSLIWARKIASVQEGVDAALAEYGRGASWTYMPDGALSLPVRKKA
jgi:nickel-dependent lactate racemase